MSSSFEGKVALVTGAAGGIGRASSLAFAAAGAAVVLADRDEAAGSRLADEIERSGGHAGFVQADVAKAADTERMVAFATKRPSTRGWSGFTCSGESARRRRWPARCCG
jgi:NAD(P)-dependent dehydrogenase (short-subunit alcohol dehydrogenase family)